MHNFNNNQTGKTIRRRDFISIMAAAFASLASGHVSAHASAWPTRPIRLIVPFPAGSGADITARIVMDNLGKRLKQTIIIENRPGAAGTLGASLVSQAPPDGNTLMLTSSSFAIIGEVYKGLTFSPSKDFLPIAPLSNLTCLYVSSKVKGYKTLQDLVQASKSKELNYASAGVGSVTHLAGAALTAAAGIRAIHVPYKGTVEAIRDLLAGRVDFFLTPIAIALPYIHSGTLVALAVADKRRAALLPKVPTTVEEGYPTLQFPAWMGVFAPAHVSSSIADKCNEFINETLHDPRIKNSIIGTGSEVFSLSRSKFTTFVDEEFRRYAELVRAANLKVT